MQFFYDGQIRRYVTQVMRVMSNFVVQYGDGSLHQVPVAYGDQDRQAASIVRQNSENVTNSVPRISVYITGLQMDRERLADSTFVGKLHFRERDVAGSNYTNAQGRNYTVERIMPTPFKLTMKCDIWATNTQQKLQIMEQILVLFNPSLELQTTDNYIDWTSLTVLNINDLIWSSRSVPQGVDSAIDVATITLDTPIWISPPVKVKHLGVITKIITNVYGSSGTSQVGYIDGLGVDAAGSGTTTLSDLLNADAVTVGGYQIQIYNGQAILLDADSGFVPGAIELDVPTATGPEVDWNTLFDQYPGKYVAGSSMLYLQQPNGTYVIGTIAVNALDATKLQVNWNADTIPSNTGIDSNGYLETDVTHYNAAGSNRPNSPGTFDAIINPLTYNPGTVTTGTRFLIIEDIGAAINVTNNTSATAWGNLVAVANDIIEWNGSAWHVVFNSVQESDTIVWQTNIYTGIQYRWNGIAWVKSFEGEYSAGQWKIVL